jgi:hypothetical protein
VSLQHWENSFAKAIEAIPADERANSGALLPMIPPREDWERFVADVRSEWWRWEWVFTLNPACLVVLYDGAAFYNYRSGAFWDDFARGLGLQALAPNAQAAINRRFTMAAQHYGLRVVSGNYVGSAVAHIGIPISMWEAFLLVCQWALWTDHWDRLDASAWREAMARRLGGRVLLINFLVNNRETATDFMREMLDARQLLSSDKNLTLSDAAQLVFLRAEYFEEVPETADFLRPDDPESLLADRARLAWNEERQMISLHLPPLSTELLPAVWRCGEKECSALSTASEMEINGAAFERILRLEISNAASHVQRVTGIDGWALYDEAKSRFVNRERDLLPVSQYTVISRHPLHPQLEGWSRDPDDPAVDLEHQLRDGTKIFITRLFPDSRRPRLKIGDKCLRFAQRRGVELRIFCGSRQSHAARFSLLPDGTLRTERWPRPFLEVPLSLVPDDNIAEEFTVFLDGQQARGKWRTFDYEPQHATAEDAELALCFWDWDENPIAMAVPAVTTAHSFAALDEDIAEQRVTDWKGKHILHVQSRRLGRLPFGTARECHFELVSPTPDAIWPASWDDYIAWVFLTQVQDHATWSEVCFAREAVAMWAININLNAVYYQLRKLERHGFLVTRGHSYRNFRSRISLANAPNGAFRGEYCGLTSALYELVRKALPSRIVVASREAGRPAKLHIDWPQRERYAVRDACQKASIEIVPKLW